MAARKRMTGESFKLYRERLKKEEKALMQKLAGTVLWPGEWGTARKVLKSTGMFMVGEYGRSVKLY